MLKCRGLDLGALLPLARSGRAYADQARLTASELTDEQRTKVLFRLEGFASSYPRAAAPRRLALDVATGAEFEERVTEYLIKGLERGVPSLFVDVKGLYGNVEKLQVVQKVAEGLKSRLEGGGCLREAEGQSSPASKFTSDR